MCVGCCCGAYSKDRSERLHDIADARLELKEASASAPLSASRPRGLPWIAAFFAAIANLHEGNEFEHSTLNGTVRAFQRVMNLRALLAITFVGIGSAQQYTANDDSQLPTYIDQAL
jgi:hypothetical protein